MKRGRRVAWLAGVLGAVVLVALGVAAKDRILEEWYLYRLEAGSEKEREAAAEVILELRSVRALVPVMVALLPPRDLQPVTNANEAEDLSLPLMDMDIRILFMSSRGLTPSRDEHPEAPGSTILGERAPVLARIEETCRSRGPKAVPSLLGGLQHQDREVRVLSAHFLGCLKGDAASAIHALDNCLHAPGMLLRRTAAEAIAKIRGEDFDFERWSQEDPEAWEHYESLRMVR